MWGKSVWGRDRSRQNQKMEETKKKWSLSSCLSSHISKEHPVIYPDFCSVISDPGWKLKLPLPLGGPTKSPLTKTYASICGKEEGEKEIRVRTKRETEVHRRRLPTEASFSPFVLMVIIHL